MLNYSQVIHFDKAYTTIFWTVVDMSCVTKKSGSHIISRQIKFSLILTIGHIELIYNNVLSLSRNSMMLPVPLSRFWAPRNVPPNVSNVLLYVEVLCRRGKRIVENVNKPLNPAKIKCLQSISTPRAAKLWVYRKWFTRKYAHSNILRELTLQSRHGRCILSEDARCTF